MAIYGRNQKPSVVLAPGSPVIIPSHYAEVIVDWFRLEDGGYRSGCFD